MQEKLQTKLEVRVKLLQSIPEMLNGLVGQENAKRGVLKVFHALQDQRLNKHLFYVSYVRRIFVSNSTYLDLKLYFE